MLLEVSGCEKRGKRWRKIRSFQSYRVFGKIQSGAAFSRVETTNERFTRDVMGETADLDG